MPDRNMTPRRSPPPRLPMTVLWLFLLLLGAKATPAGAQEDYILKAWMMDDGLPQNAITTVLQSSDGYLWLGTELGLVRFNGTAFRVFNHWNTPEMENSRVLSLLEDAENTLWIGTDGGGITRLADRDWRHVPLPEPTRAARVQTVFQPAPAYLWLGTDRGLVVVENGTPLGPPENKALIDVSIRTIVRTTDGAFWIGTDQGLFESPPEAGSRSPEPNKIADLRIRSLVHDRRGGVWVGAESGLWRIRAGEPARFARTDAALTRNITALHEDPRGDLWVGTYGEGLFLIRGDGVHHYSSAEGLSDDFIHSITSDHEGNLWVGTFAGGVVQLRPRLIHMLDSRNGLPGDAVTAVLEDRNGSWWIGCPGEGLCVFRDGRLQRRLLDDPDWKRRRIATLAQTLNGDIWIGTSEAGLHRLTTEKTVHYGLPQGLPATRVQVVVQDRSGVLWIGTANGLAALINDNVVAQKAFDGRDIRAITETPDGRLWVGGSQGLSVIETGNVRHLPIPEGLARFEVLVLFASDREPDTLWIGTNGMGLWRRRGDSYAGLQQAHGLPSDHIFSIIDTTVLPVPVDTPEGVTERRLWMSSYTGVFTVPIRELDGYFRGETDRITAAVLNEPEGMTTRECIGNVAPAVCKTRNNLLLYPTVKGTAIIDPGKISATHPAPKIVLEDVLIDNESYRHRRDPKISSGKRMFEFYFSAVHLTAPRKVFYRYRLEGFEKGWTISPPSQKPTALYFNLGPGIYTFRVAACNPFGKWNETDTLFSFRIRSDFEKSLKVYLPRILLLLILALGFFIWRVRKGSNRSHPEKKYRTSALTQDRADDVMQKLLAKMETEEVYLNPDLTLKKLAEMLMVHPNHLSQIINEKLNQSFNDFINKYRIVRAQEKLRETESSEKTVLEIAYDVGFYSKSVFNTAFKKFTGQTPTEFKRKPRD